MGNPSPMEVLESEQTLFHNALDGANTQRPFRPLAQDTGKAPICDELGTNVPLMPVGESINEIDDMRLREVSALGHCNGGEARLT